MRPADQPHQQVWYVSGDEEKYFFKTKMDAEMYARIHFPDEDPSKRYARIYFKTVYTFEEVK